jgi:hypothetical protein
MFEYCYCCELSRNPASSGGSALAAYVPSEQASADYRRSWHSALVVLTTYPGDLQLLATGQFSIDAPFQYRIVTKKYAHWHPTSQARVGGKVLGRGYPPCAIRLLSASLPPASPPSWRRIGAAAFSRLTAARTSICTARDEMLGMANTVPIRSTTSLELD